MGRFYDWLSVPVRTVDDVRLLAECEVLSAHVKDRESCGCDRVTELCRSIF
jgi:hypothetical protein